MITLIFTCETAQSILSFFYPMEEFIVANDFHGYKYTQDGIFIFTCYCSPSIIQTEKCSTDDNIHVIVSPGNH